MIEFVNVCKKYHYADYAVFDGFSLRAELPATVMLDVQSGKTTLCKLLLGLEKFDGEIFYRGQNLAQLSPRERNFCYLPKDFLLFAGKSALYNVAYPLKIRGIDAEAAERAATEALAKFYDGDIRQKMKKADFGQKFAVTLAKIACRKPDLLLIDGFFDVLEPSQADAVLQLAGQLGCDLLQVTDRIEKAFGKIYLWKDDRVFCGDKPFIEEQMKKVLWLGKEEL